MLSVAGLVSFTTIDYPGALSAVVFFKGCPLRCPFCHNPNLQELGAGEMEWTDILSFLSERTKRLDGVVLSGGEPLMQPEILEAVRAIKDMGFKVAIHTSGVYPEKLAEMAPLVDWVGLDVKAPWNKYELLSGRAGLTDKIKQTIKVLQEAGIPFEARTTCDPRHLNKADIERLTDTLQKMGVMIYAMQKYRTFDGDKNPPSVVDIEAFFNDAAWLKSVENKFTHFFVR